MALHVYIHCAPQLRLRPGDFHPRAADFAPLRAFPAALQCRESAVLAQRLGHQPIEVPDHEVTGCALDLAGAASPRSDRHRSPTMHTCMMDKLQRVACNHLYSMSWSSSAIWSTGGLAARQLCSRKSTEAAIVVAHDGAIERKPRRSPDCELRCEEGITLLIYK